MKHYKDDCHHYKVLDNHRVVTVTDLGKFSTRISFNDFGKEHHIIQDIREKRAKPCTEKEYLTAFDKALKTINNLK